MKIDHRALAITLIASVILTTLFIRVPLGGGGYFNFGDIAVVFSGLIYARFRAKRAWLVSAIIGGAGSAGADVLAGYALFAPITLVAKGLEGGLAGLAGTINNHAVRYAFLTLGGIAMVLSYFVGEYFLPAYGLQGAIKEVLPNLIQAGGGVVGGVIVARIFAKALASPGESSDAGKVS